MKTKFLKRAIAAVTALILSVCVLTPAAAGNAAEKNLYWPEDRVFPAFSAPEGPLVAFPGDLFSAPGMTALACLQGFANAVTPRAVILDIFFIQVYINKEGKKNTFLCLRFYE